MHHHGALETFFAVASETAVSVLTGAVTAHTAHDVTFIDICNESNYSIGHSLFSLKMTYRYT